MRAGGLQLPPFVRVPLTAVQAGLRGTPLALTKVWVLKPEAGGGQLWGSALSERMSVQQAVQALSART